MHARLHPERADVYLELPGWPELAAVLRSTPVARTLREREVIDALAEWLPEDTVEGAWSVQPLLERMGLAPETAAAIDRTLRDSRGVSLSLTGLSAAPGQIDDLRDLLSVRDKLKRLDSAVWDHVLASAGEFPESLDELDLSDRSDLLDAWGHPFRYELPVAGQFEKQAFVLKSLGADGEEGGEGSAADLSLGDDLQEALLDRLLDQLGALLVIELESSDAAESRAKLLADPVELPHVRTFSMGARILVAVGSVGEDETRARARGEAPSLADEASFVRAGRQLLAVSPTEPGALVCRGYRTRSIASLLAGLEDLGLGGGTIDEAAGFMATIAYALGGDGPTAWRMQVEDGLVVTESFQLETEQGVGRWMGTRPLGTLTGSTVPSDAMAVFVCSVDGAALWSELSGAHAVRTGEDLARLENRVEERTGSRPGRDLFGRLRGNLFAWVMPLGGWMLPKLTVALELDRSAGVLEQLQALADALHDELPETVRVRTQTWRGEQLLILEGDFLRGLSGPWGELEPTLFVHDDHLFVASSSSQAKREIKRLDGSEQATRHPLFANHAASLERTSRALSMDWGVLIESLDQALRTMASLAGAIAGDVEGLDLASLPDVSLLTRRLQPTVRWSIPSEGGIYTRHAASFGPETWVGLPLAIERALAEREEAQANEPEVEEADEELDWTLAVLEELHLGLELYARELRSYPRVLEELTESTEAFPRGFLSGRDVPPDGWGHPFRYERGRDGGGYRVWSVGPDGVDDGGEGDDVSGP